jgi:hypothetical protein
MSHLQSEDRAVLFIDLLGFAMLTERHCLDFEAIRRRQNILNVFDSVVGTPNPLTETFTSFQYTLKWAIELAQMRHPLTAITFSDSAFFVTSQLSECVDIAVNLVQSLLRRQVAARAAIAWGTFAAIRFKSDVMGEWGDHAAHFLGTGVVRSNAAEKCGIKGIRILLHPSAAALLASRSSERPIGSDIRCIRCAVDELSNDVGVQYEIDYWRLKRTAETIAWHAFQDMWTSAPVGAVKHYEATAQAIDRMRVGQGEAPLETLRRRTLPRRNQPTSRA